MPPSTVKLSMAAQAAVLLLLLLGAAAAAASSPAAARGGGGGDDDGQERSQLRALLTAASMSALVADLAAKRASFVSSSIPNYDFVLERPVVPTTASYKEPGPFRVEVRNSAVVSVTLVEDGTSLGTTLPNGIPLTIEDLYGWIETWIAENPDLMRVAYRDTKGDGSGIPYPYDIYVNPISGFNNLGEEVRMKVEEFTPRFDITAMTDPDQDLLDVNRNLWDEAGLANYDFIITQNCPDCANNQGPIYAEVRAGVVDSINPATPATIRTVVDLFDFVQSALDDGDDLEVSYNEGLGYPEEISNPAEGTQLLIHKLRSREEGAEELSPEPCGPAGTVYENECDWTEYCCNPSCGICAPIGGFCKEQICEGGIDVDTEQARLDNNTAKWNNSNVIDYNFTYLRTCNCLPEYVGPWDVEVQGGLVNRATPTPPSDLKLPTIPGLLGVIQSAIKERVYSMQASYDQTYGYPFDVFINHDFRIADEETAFDVTNFAPLLVN